MTHANDLKYRNFIKGKRVIFVGPSPCILGEDRGSFIDSFDVIIRTNGSFPVSEEYQRDYGKRCDSLYVNGLFAREMKLPIVEYKSKGLQYLNMKEDVKNISARYRNSGIKFRVITRDYIKSRRDIKAPALMGTYIIWEILNMKPACLYLTGMDCYSNDNINEHYLNGYLPNSCNIERLNSTRIKAHKQEIQNNYIRDKIKSGLVTADGHVLKSLSI